MDRGPDDPTRHLQFDAAPVPGYDFTVTDVSFNYGDHPIPFNTNILKSQVYYSTDGWSSSTPLSSSPLAYLNTSMTTFAMSGLSVPVPTGQTFSLRIYPYALSNGIAATPTFATHNPVTIAGETRPAGGGGEKGKLCVFKFLDANGNGKQDGGEPPLDGWVFLVKDASGNVLATLTTNAQGGACAAVTAGNYTVSEIPQTGYVATTPTT